MEDKFSVLERIFGYKTFRSGQETLIDAILAGRDAVGIMPTGAGKSLCYQVPALLMEGVTLVVSPLISLMKDQVGSLVQAGIRGAYLNSSLTAAQVTRVLENMRYGQYKIIYVAPERLMTERFLETVSEMDISFVAVDEAHCVSQWGQDFRPSYLDVARFIETLPKRPVVAAFTATATDQVRRDMVALLGLFEPFSITTGFDRANLHLEVQSPANRTDAILQFVGERREKSGIIYCLTRKEVERVTDLLQKRGIPATRYHAGLSEGERRQNQEQFQADVRSVMVATNAFGMGIDKSNVSYVLHCGMPKNLESYYQEAGRAGRDGAPAECVLFYAERDIMTNLYFIQRDDEEQEEMDPALREALQARDRERLNQMVGYCKTTACLRKYILAYFGETGETSCGNCFNCLHTFDEADITGEARQILTCVRELNERFGRQVVADTLSGKVTGKSATWGLERHSTYGALAHLTKKRILELMSALVDMDYLTVTESDIQRGIYPVVKLGQRARDVLEEEASVVIRVLQKPPEEPKSVRRSRKRAEREQDHPGDNTLFAKLKARRTELARTQGVPPYMIFSDATLIQMSVEIPATKEEFLTISGVGQTKLSKYGDDFLTILREHRAESAGVTASPRWSAYEETILETQAKEGISAEEIAGVLGRSVEDVRGKLAELGF